MGCGDDSSSVSRGKMELEALTLVDGPYRSGETASGSDEEAVSPVCALRRDAADCMAGPTTVLPSRAGYTRPPPR